MIKKFLITGAPCSGKSSVLELLRKEFLGRIMTVPEIPSLFVSNGMTPDSWNSVIGSLQKDVEFIKEIIRTRLHLEHHFEQVARLAGVSYLLCDRGLADAAAYLNGNYPSYETLSGRDLSTDVNRYSHVLLFGTVAAVEPLWENKALDKITDPEREFCLEIEFRLKEMWSKHSSYFYVPVSESIQSRYEIVRNIILELMDTDENRKF